eukprot:scaffold755_cov122-Isochrysis_galbana.AAC.4
MEACRRSCAESASTGLPSSPEAAVKRRRPPPFSTGGRDLRSLAWERNPGAWMRYVLISCGRSSGLLGA